MSALSSETFLPLMLSTMVFILSAVFCYCGISLILNREKLLGICMILLGIIGCMVWVGDNMQSMQDANDCQATCEYLHENNMSLHDAQNICPRLIDEPDQYRHCRGRGMFMYNTT